LWKFFAPAPFGGFESRPTCGTRRRRGGGIAEQQAGIKADLEKRYGAGLNVTYSVDPSLIGGLRIQVGSDLYDGSVKTRLEKLAQSFNLISL